MLRAGCWTAHHQRRPFPGKALRVVHACGCVRLRSVAVSLPRRRDSLPRGPPSVCAAGVASRLPWTARASYQAAGVCGQRPMVTGMARRKTGAEHRGIKGRCAGVAMQCHYSHEAPGSDVGGGHDIVPACRALHPPSRNGGQKTNDTLVGAFRCAAVAPASLRPAKRAHTAARQVLGCAEATARCQLCGL